MIAMGTLQGGRRDGNGLRTGAENPGRWVDITDGGQHAGFTIKTVWNMLMIAHYPPESLLTLAMVKAKKTHADQINAGTVVEGSRNRRAKTDALNNAVWKQLAPGAGKKRAASTSPQRKAVRKKARKNNNKDVVDATTKSSKQVELATPNGIANTSVSIFLPGAPKKKPMATTKAGKAQLAPKTNRKGKKDDPVVAAEIETDKEDASISTESIFSSDSEEDGEDEDDDDIVSVNEVMETGHQTQSAADKRFANEQPVWSDQTVGNATKESARQLLMGDSDKENNVNPQPRKTLLIRGQVIEVTDEEDQNDLDESPSARLVPPSSRPSGGETLNDVGGHGTIWPVYTYLVKGNRDLVLSVQSHELKLVIRKAMDLIEERMRFLNAFPDFVLRTVWHRAALIEACTIIHDMVHANDRYDIIKERMRVDVDYVGEIAKSLLDPRISILRGNTKILAVNNTRASFGLQDGCSQQVNRLLIGSHYIYPPAANGVGLQLNKPFENKAIIGTLHEDLFSGSNTITLKYLLRFRPTDTEPDPNKLAPATIALAATTVFASLKEWENGHRVQTHFTANLYEMIYLGHIKHLLDIQEKNVRAYDALVRRLFRMASYAENVEVALNMNLTDVQHMATDV